MKKIIIRHFISILMITSVNNFSFVGAQFIQTARGTVTEEVYCKTSTICWTASEPVTFMLDFVREMINSMKTMWTEWDYLGKYINPNRFEWNTFVPPKKTVVGILAKSIAQKAKFGFASTAVLTSPVNFGWLKDLVWWTILTAKNKVFLRDSKLVEQMESQLSDKKLELGLWWWWYAKINEQNLVLMRAIMDKYIKMWIFANWSIENWASYNNVTSFLTSMLSSIKTFLYFDTVSQFNQITRWWSNGIKITFNTQSMNTIQADYNCARWYLDVCNKNKNKFLTVWKNFTAGLKTAGSDTIKVVTDASKRLVQVFSPSQQDEVFKARENDLLRSMYGNTNVKRGKLIDVSVKQNNGNIQDLSWVVKTAVRSWNFLTKDIRSKKAEIEVANTAVASATTTTSPSSVSSSDTTTNDTSSYTITNDKLSNETFTNYITPYIDAIFVDQARDNNLAGFVEVKDVTPAFNVLWLQIYTIRNNIIGGKDKDGSLIKSLWEACELQCGRGWSCR